MARSRASVTKTPWPEKIRFHVLRDLERSGVRWFPASSWLRRYSGIPSSAPSMGAAQREVSCKQESYIDIVVVNTATGAPTELTPAEIYSLAVTKTISPTEQVRGWKELLAKGASQSQVETVRLIAPIHKSVQKYEEAVPVQFTAEGAARKAMTAEIADFTPMPLAG